MTRVLMKPPTQPHPHKEGHPHHNGEGTGRPVASGPNSVLSKPPPQRVGVPTPQGGVLTHDATRATLRQCSTHEQPPRTRTARAWPLPPAPATPRRALPRRTSRQPPGIPGPDGDELLRKEVIQPHLPVRLPCYDLVPIASPTFDHSLPQGVGP